MNTLSYLCASSLLLQVAWSCSGGSDETTTVAGSDDTTESSAIDSASSGEGSETSENADSTKQEDFSEGSGSTTKGSGIQDKNIPTYEKAPAGFNTKKTNMKMDGITVTAIVMDAVTKKGLDGATMFVPLKFNARKTDSGGKLNIGSWKSGEKAAGSAEKDGYHKTFFEYTVIKGDTQNLMIGMTPSLASDEYLISLVWQGYATDLDLRVNEIYAENRTDTRCSIGPHYLNKKHDPPEKCPEDAPASKIKSEFIYYHDNYQYGDEGPEAIRFKAKQKEYYYLVYVSSYNGSQVGISQAHITINEGKAENDKNGLSFFYDKDCNGCPKEDNKIKIWAVGCFKGEDPVNSWKPIGHGLKQESYILEYSKNKDIYGFCIFD